jgi:hypothetical protein
MSDPVRVTAFRPSPVNSEKLWNQARAAWATLIDISDAGGGVFGFDFSANPPAAAQVQGLVDAHDPSVPQFTPAQLQQIAADKAQVVAFFNAASGTATPTQRDDTIKAIIRFLRRSGNDA